MWDNSDTLISYIRHTFITCDDSGLCEAALRLPAPNGEKPGAIRVFHEQGGESDRGKKYHGNEDDDLNDGSSTSDHSPDIHADVGHRRRSETSKRLETLKQQRIAQSKIKTVQWKEPAQSATASSSANAIDATTPVRRVTVSNGDSTDNNNVPIFTKVDVDDLKRMAASTRSKRSAVSKLVQACPDLPVNPFQEYMKFDGNASIGTSSRTIRVFPLMASSDFHRSRPLEVCVSSSAKVSDLIGLICFHYTTRNLMPKLSTDISRYALFVAEDTGEVDSDLPPRSPHENVSRFHFPYLALVDRGAASSSSDGHPGTAKKYYVIVHVSTGEKFKLELDSLDTPLRTVRDSALAMRFAKEKMKKGLEYNIEKLNEPNVSLPLDATVSSAATTEFVLVRAFSARGDLTPGTPVAAPPVDYSVPSPAYPMVTAGPATSQYYTVTMLRKFKRDAKVQLMISRDRLEIAPLKSEERKLSTNSAAKLFRSFRQPTGSGGTDDGSAAAGHHHKSVEFNLSRLGGAEIMEDKGDRKIFRIVHKHQSNSGGAVSEWKSHQFEADSAIAEEIVRTVNRYLDLARGEVRQEFLRRTPRKSSFFKRLQLGDLSFGDVPSGTTPQN